MSAFKLFALAATGAALAVAPMASAASLTSGEMPAAAAPAHTAPLSLHILSQPSSAPEPGAWAMMLAGFAGAGTVLRRRGRRYRLVEARADGGESTEEFEAPDDATALRRVASVTTGHVELWRGAVRIAPQPHA